MTKDAGGRGRRWAVAAGRVFGERAGVRGLVAGKAGRLTGGLQGQGSGNVLKAGDCTGRDG